MTGKEEKVYEVIKTINGIETKVLKTDNRAEAEYVVTAMKYNGIDTVEYRRVTR